MKIVIIIAVLVSLAQTNAFGWGVIEADYLNPGDKLITDVPAIELEWLDLTETLFTSVTSVEAGFGGFIDDGFYVPTVAQVFDLFHAASDFTLNPNNSSPIKEEYDFVNDADAGRLLLLGPTAGNGIVRSDIRGFAERDLGSGVYDLIIAAFHFDSNGFVIQGNIQYLKQGMTADRTEGDNTDGIFLARQSSSVVPEPSSLVLFGLGCFCLIVFIKHRRTTESAA